jgi:hypothetical protein
MAISAQCPTCGEWVQAEKGQVGKLLTCDNCGGPVRIREQAAAPSRGPAPRPPPSPGPAPTPPSPAGQWYYRVLGKEFGPISFADLQRRAQDRQVGPDNEVRLGSSGWWLLAERVPHLFDAPGPEPAQWFYTQGGRQFGPVDLDTVKRLVDSGVLPGHERVRERRWASGVKVRRWVASGFSVQRPLSSRESGEGPVPDVPAPAAPSDLLPAQASLPPPAPRAEWFYLDRGQRVGPLPLQSLQGLLQAGQLGRHDLVWKEGMADWQAIGSLAELETGRAGAPAGRALGTPR